MRKFFAALSLVLCSAAVSAQTQNNFDTQIAVLKPDVLLRFDDASGNIVDALNGTTFTASDSGTIDYRQISSLPGRYAERFTYDAKATAPNSTLANYDWAQAWWAVVRVNIDFSRSNSTRLELFSRGTQNATLDFSDATGSGYDAWIQWVGSQASACLMLSSSVATGSASGVTTCLNVDIPSGIPVTLAFTYDGSGTAAGINIYAEGQGTPIFSNFNTQTYGTPNAHTMASTSHPLILFGDEANNIASQGGNVHNNAPTVAEELAIGRGTLSDTTIQSLVALGGNWRFQGLPAPAHTNIIVDNDGCSDTDNLTMLAVAIRLHRLGYVNLLLVNNTEMGDVSVAIYRQMLDGSGLGHVPSSSSQGSWTGAVSAGSGCVAAVAAYNATNVTRANTQSDVVGYRTALANAADSSVHIVVGGAMRGIFDLLNSPADGISSLTGQQLFAAKVVDIHWQAQAVGSGDFNIAEDIAGAQYVLANAGVPIYFYGTNNIDFGISGPNQQLTRVPTDPYGAAIGANSPGGRGSFDIWPLLGVLDQSKFWTIGTPGTVTIAGDSSTTFSTATNNKMYEVSNNSSYPVTFAQKALGSWFINSLVNPIPGRIMPTPTSVVPEGLTPTTRVYVDTTFNEHTSGGLAGTVPAIFGNGASGTWLASNANGVTSDWSYINPGAQVTGLAGGGGSPEYINIGHADYTMRVSQKTAAPGTTGQIYFRYTPNTLNFVVLEIDGGAHGLTLLDISGGTNTAIGTPSGVTCGTNTITIITKGNHVSASCNGGTTSGDLPGGTANLTATYVGMVDAGTGDTWSLSEISVKNN